MIYKRAYLHHNTQYNQNVDRTHTKAIRRSLLVDSTKQAERCADEIVVCLEMVTGIPQYLHRAYTTLKMWYSHASVRAPNLSQADMAKFKGKYPTL